MIKTFVSLVSLTLCFQAFAQDMDHSHHQMPSADEAMPMFGMLHPDFELVNRDGGLVKMSDYQGSFLLVGFGFTHCSYVCPTMAANMAGALRDLESEDIDAKGIFISVDTERDSPEVAHRYAQAFNKNMIGLSGSYEQVSATAKNFRVNFAVTKTPDEYIVQHTANIYVIDPEGKFVDSFAINASPQELADAMR